MQRIVLCLLPVLVLGAILLTELARNGVRGPDPALAGRTEPAQGKRETKAPGDVVTADEAARDERALLGRSEQAAGEGEAAGRDVSAAERETTRQAELEDFRTYAEANLLEIRQRRAAQQRLDLSKRREGIDSTMRGLERRLGLTSSQSAKLRAELLSQLDLESYYVDQYEKGADEKVLEAIKDDDREVHRRALEAFLSSEQLAKFWAK